MNTAALKPSAAPRDLSRHEALRPQASEFLFSGRGPLRRFQIEALRQRRSLRDEPRTLASAA